MGMTSAGEPKAWITNLDRHTLGLKVVLLKEVFVLPRNQFLYAQGGDDEVRAVFTTHDVVAKAAVSFHCCRIWRRSRSRG